MSFTQKIKPSEFRVLKNNNNNNNNNDNDKDNNNLEYYWRNHRASEFSLKL